MSAIAFGSQITQPRLRITRRGRAVLTLLIAVPLAIGAAVTGIGAIGAAAGTQGSTATFHSASFQYVTVEPGESLWQVAQSVAPNADPRDVIGNILSLNDLSSGDVQPGQSLAIPTQYISATNGH
jgi:hypothetical protein